MKNKFVAIVLMAVSTSSFSYSCFESVEYKDSLKIAQDAGHERSAAIGVAVEFLQKAQGLDFDHALKEFMQQKPTPETLSYDDALKNAGNKIQTLKPQSPEECSTLIKLQREYEKIGKNKIEFLVNKILEQPMPSANSNNDNDGLKY